MIDANQVIRARGAKNRKAIPVAGGEAVFEGTLVYVNGSGFATGSSGVGTYPFAGVAVREANNVGGGNGDRNVEVWTDGVFELAGSGFTAVSVGQLVYGVDNGFVSTFSAGAVIGRIQRVIDSATVEVSLTTRAALGPSAIGPLLNLWIDPSDLSTMDLADAALFGAGSSGPYLSTADHADFNFSAGQVFTVEFWRNNTGRQDGVNGVDRGFVGQYNYNSDASWVVSSDGSSTYAMAIRVGIAANASGTDMRQVKTEANGPDWSHCVVTFDGTQATHTDRIRIYRDGSLVNPATYSYAGTIPATLNNSSAALTIGRILGVWNLADAAINRVRLWNAKLSADAITTLWNNGVGYYHNELPSWLKALSLVGSWDCTEPAGTPRLDRSGREHHMAEVGGNVGQAKLVMQLRAKGTGGFVFTPITSAQPFTVLGFAGAPRWLETGLFDRPCLDYCAWHGMRCAAAQPLDLASFDIVETIRIASFQSSEGIVTVSADEATANAYWFTGEVLDSGQRKTWMRWRDNNVGSFNTNVMSDQILSLDTDYVWNWRVLGAGGTASHVHRVNGVEKTLTYATNSQNKSLDDVPGRDNLTLGCLVRSDGNSAGFAKRWRHGQLLVAGPGLTVAQNLAMEAFVQ